MIYVSSVSPSSERTIRSDEGLTLETSAFQSLYGGQFTLSTLLINQMMAGFTSNYVSPSSYLLIYSHLLDSVVFPFRYD